MFGTLIHDCRYRQTGEKNAILFKTLVNALKNSPSITVHTAKTLSCKEIIERLYYVNLNTDTNQAHYPSSAYRFDQNKDEKQQQQQKSVVFSCQSPSARIDLIARKRVAEACEVSSHEIASSEVSLTEEAKGKQPLRQSGPAETEDSTTRFIGTVVITPTVGNAQLILKISQKTTVWANTFLPPKISFRLTIPSTSEIFEIAAFGTVYQLREMLESRAESWNVCDENGVSPIQVASSTEQHDNTLTEC